MGQYNIKQLELVSGIKAHTIRIWEKRYKLLSPNRTDTNIRKYSDSDLQHLLNVSFLNNQGLKISKIAQKSLEEIQNLVKQYSSNNLENNFNFDKFFFDIISLNENNIRMQLQDSIEKMGIERAFEKLVSPILNRIGILWQSGMITPVHEHLVTNIVKHIIIYQISTLPELGNRSKQIVFFLPEGELHEIGLLYYNYLARKNGFTTIYFGQTTPIRDLLLISDKLRPYAFFTSITTYLNGFDPVQLFNELHTNFPDAKIFATGYVVDKEKNRLSDRVTFISNADEFVKQIVK